MAHLYKMTEYQSQTGYWHCADVSDLAAGSASWWLPARLLDLTPAAFIEKLIKDYKPDKISWNGKIFLYSWRADHYNLAHSFLLWINRESRKRNFII